MCSSMVMSLTKEVDDEARSIPPPRSTQLTAVSTTRVTGMTSPWLLAAGAVTGRLWAELAQLSGNLTLTPQVRFAAVSTDQPEAWATFGSTLTTNEQKASDSTLTGMVDKLWVQFALGKQSTSVGEGVVSLQPSVVGNGAVVGARRIELAANVLNASASGVWEVGKPFPAVGLTGLMFGFVFSGIGSVGALTGSAVARLYKGDASDPSTQWGAPTGGSPGASFSIAASTTVSRLNTGTMTPPSTSGYSLCQAGVAFNGANPQASVAVLVAAIYG